MGINNKPEVKEPEKTGIRELNDNELDAVNGGVGPAFTPQSPGIPQTPTPAPPRND